MLFSEVFHAPFRTDPGNYELYIWCDKQTMCYNILKRNTAKRIVALLNGEEGTEPFDNLTISGDFITQGYAPLLMIRGWGRLTGLLRIDPIEAASMQRAFMEWTINKLKGQ